jgi:hypothetical protein
MSPEPPHTRPARRCKRRYGRIHDEAHDLVDQAGHESSQEIEAKKIMPVEEAFAVDFTMVEGPSDRWIILSF